MAGAPSFPGRSPSRSSLFANPVKLCDRAPVDGNIPNVLRNPCGTGVSPTTARNSAFGPGKEHLINKTKLRAHTLLHVVNEIDQSLFR
jgi:hypothetical protein